MTESFEHVDEQGDMVAIGPNECGTMVVSLGDQGMPVYLDQDAINELAQYLDGHRTDTTKAVESKPAPLYLDRHAANRLAQYLDGRRTDTPKAVEPLPADATLCGTRWTQVREDMADMDRRLREAERTLARAEAVKEHADTVDAARQAGALKCACRHGWSEHGLNGCGAERLDFGMGSRCMCTRFTLGAQ